MYSILHLKKFNELIENFVIRYFKNITIFLIKTMTSELPFAKKESQVRPCVTPTSCKMFGQIVFHSPLNKQNIGGRDFQEGNLRQVQMKASVRAIDGRVGKVERNRLNMFRDANISPSFTAPPVLETATRHGKTPYTYNTSWIDHPPENTSLHPNKSEKYFTSFLSTPNANADSERRARSTLSKYEAIRYNQEHFRQYVNQIDDTIAATQNKNIEDIRAQRKNHLEALEARNRIEKINML